MKAALFAAALVAAGTLATPVAAFGYGATLTFTDATCGGGQACGNTSEIDQNYGDGVLHDVRYNRDILNPAYTTGAAGSGVRFWANDYNDLQGVAWGDFNGTPMLFLAPTTGNAVTLLGFDLGAWPQGVQPTQFTIVDGLGNTLYSSGAITVGTGNVHSHFAFNLTSASGIGIQWGPDGYNVGLDNVAFEVDVAPVPEPGEWAMMGLGLAVVGAAARRRRTI